MPGVTSFSVPSLTHPTVVDETSEISPSKDIAVLIRTMVRSWGVRYGVPVCLR